MKEKQKKNLQKVREGGIYLLPNILTSFSLFAGFYSITSSVNDEFMRAAMAILVAIFFDSIDGKVARLTKTTSKFGVEYDSLSDLVSFGVAPAVLAYTLALSAFGRWGFGASFLFMACAAMRLARFNIQVGTIEKKYFNGLPSPAAAGMLAMTIILYLTPERVATAARKMPISITLPKLFDQMLTRPIDFLLSRHMTLLVLVVALALFMVSSIKYYSFKEFDLIQKKPFYVLFLIFIILVLVAAEPEKMLFAIMTLYLVSGPVISIADLFKKKPLPPKEAKEALRQE
jgi:CDP-diacylglycerol--serine O-phosphatidyltransferase